MKNNQELNDLDEMIQKELSKTQNLAMNNSEELYQAKEKIQEIQEKRIVNIKNENKKSKWFVGGIKSTGKWFKNFFSTPKMETKPKKKQEIQINQQQEIIEDDFDKLHFIVKNNNKEIKNQSKQINEIKIDLQTQLDTTQKLNKDINKIVNNQLLYISTREIICHFFFNL